MQQTKLPQRPTFFRDILFLTLILGSLFFILAGTRPLFVPDEGRYAEIGREMALTGDYVTPYLNSIKYFEKPVFFYWLEAIAIQIGGVNLWSLRSINALLGLMGCLFTYSTARRFFGRTTGILASLILGTSTLFFVMSHTISLDLPVSVLLSSCLFSFILGTETPMGMKRRLWFWAAAAAAACAVLTKGLIGLVFPGMIICAWITLLGDGNLLKRLYLPSSIAIFLLIAAPWHLLVSHRHPEFFQFYFIEQHFLRYTTPEVGHYQPVWFFIPALILGLFPWSLFLPQTLVSLIPKLWRQRKEYKIELFFFLWAMLIFLFFSFSKSKLIPYILPVFPAFAILIANYFAAARHHKYIKGIRIGFLALFLLSLAIATVIYQFVNKAAFLDASLAKAFYYPAVIILTLGMGTAALCAMSKRVRAAFSFTVATIWLFLILALAGSPAIDNRTILPLVNIIAPRLQPQDEVMTYNQYYQDLPFYLQRRITVVDWVNELSNGMQHQDTHEWMLDDEEFWQRWHSPKTVYVITSKDEFNDLQKYNKNEHFYILGQTIDHMVISNRP